MLLLKVSNIAKSNACLERGYGDRGDRGMENEKGRGLTTPN
jgi:hypothetical protein